MTTTPQADLDGTDSQPRAMSMTTWVLLALAGVLAICLLVFGYMNSIPNVERFARSIGFAAPLEGALVVELGIPALLILDFAFVLRGHRGPWFRIGAWLLAGAVVVMNAFAPHGATDKKAIPPGGLKSVPESAFDGWQVQLFYALMPTVPILVVEGIRFWAMLETKLKHPDSAAKMDRIRRSRWLASPVRTPKLMVRMVRWEITSYREAVLREQAWLYARSVAAAELRRMGRVGRFTRAKTAWKKAPDLLLDQLRSGMLPIGIVTVLRQHLEDPTKDWQWFVATWVRTVIRDHYATESALESGPESGSQSALESGSVKALESGPGGGLGPGLSPDPEADSVRSQSGSQSGLGGSENPDSGPDSSPDPGADSGRTRTRTRGRTESASRTASRTPNKIVLGKLPTDPWEAAKVVNARFIDQTGRPVSAENLRKSMGIGKSQANELVRMLRSGQDAPDGAVRVV